MTQLTHNQAMSKLLATTPIARDIKPAVHEARSTIGHVVTWFGHEGKLLLECLAALLAATERTGIMAYCFAGWVAIAIVLVIVSVVRGGTAE